MLKKILLIDGYNTFIRSFFQIPIRNDNGEHFGGVFGFLNSLKSVSDRIQPTELVVAWDGINSSFRRKQILPEYKANRGRDGWTKGSVRAFEFETEQEQKENFNYQLKQIRQYIKFLPFKEIQLPYVEADDVIAEYVAYLKENSVNEDNKYEILIYSSDSDYRQLLKNTEKFKVICYNPINKLLMTHEEFIKQNGFLPENYSIVKSFVGDTSDNVSGLKGIGFKTIMKMYGDTLLTSTTTIESVLNYSKQINVLQPKRLSKSVLDKHNVVIENCEKLLKNWRVMQLTDTSEISINSKDIIKDVVNSIPNEYDKHEVLKMFLKDKMHSQLGKYHEWERIFLRLNNRPKNI